jgi:uncharacterized protein with PIN domain
MKYNKHNNYIDSNQLCKKCNLNMKEVTHKEITQKRLKQPFYFSKWYICPQCGWMLNLEQDKIWNNNEYSHLLKETQELDSMFKYLV